MPISLARSSSGLRAAPRAISRSLGNAISRLLCRAVVSSGLVAVAGAGCRGWWGSDSGGGEAVDADAQRLAGRGEHVEQVLARGTFTVQQVGPRAGPVVADDVGGDARQRGPQGRPVRGHLAVEVH